MLVQLPEEQTQEIQQMIATLIKNEIHHFKEDIGADSPFLNKKNRLVTTLESLIIHLIFGLQWGYPISELENLFVSIRKVSISG